MLTMKKKRNDNPLIRVKPETRRKLKMLAAHYDESMLEIVERLAQAELERIQQKGGQPHVHPHVQIPSVSE